MAFGKKYFSSYKSNNNLNYYLEIFLEDYTGSALELVMGALGPVIEYETDQEDRFSPIISSSCKIPYLVENYLDSLFIDDLRNNYQERQVYVHIYRSTQSGHSAVAPLWSGFLVMDIGSGVDKYFPYEEHLKFVDGLSLLKDIDFVDLGVSGGTPPFEERVQGNYAQENMYYGPATYIYWIREILAKSGAALTNQGASQNYGFTTSVNWYNGEMNATGQSSDPLHKTKCAVSMFHRKDDQGVFYPDNCYNVLKELLRHWGARITYWKHEFWIVQIPEYITSETGTISTPVNNNSRLYSNTGAYQGSQNHLGSTYYTRYEQTIQNDKISKLTGTKYDYLPIIKQVNADFLSFSSKSYFGGFPFGGTAPTQEVFQGTINSPSAADFLYLSIPLDWTWDLSNAPNFPNGHSNGWWCAIKFNFYASDGTTTYYLQYNSAGGNYFWVDSALWTPLGNRAPKYIISSKLAVVTGHIGFEQQIPFEDENGNAISMSGAWSFFLDIDDYGTGSSNPGSFYINFSGYGSPQRMRNPVTAIQLPAGSGVMSGTVSWSNTLVDQQGQVTISTINNPAGFNAGTANPDIRFATSSPFLGLLQTLNNTQSASFGETFNVINSNTQAKQNSEQFDFGTLLWGDSLEFAPSSLQVFNGTTYVNTEPSGEWGRGILTGTKTFTKILIDEFFSGQTKIIISPSMRLAVGVANKNEDQGGTLRPRYVNPIGKLRETRDGTDPEYFFRRGSFYTLLDEWDYEGYQIIRNVPSTTTQSNGMGSMGGSQSGSPASSGISPSPMVQALSQNSPLAYIRTTIPATGSNVAVNGNFNTAVGWSLGSGWSIDTTAKKAKFAATGSTSELTQSVLTQGLTYQVNFQVVVTAGTLLVKAGTSGTSQSITSSGDYSIYLDCEGSSLIKFQAGTTFTGNITYITLRDQKSLSSVPIEAIGTAVFKTGDTFNLINSNDDTILPLTVTSNQGSTDTTISVSSTPLYEDIDNGSYLLINQDDLSEQYQNKTKGTVAGFDITATGIAKSSINITDWLNSDTMSGAAVTNVPTALSVKNYVDSSVGASDTLQEVTDNGNTTTNSIMIGSSDSPNTKLQVGTGSGATIDSSYNIAVDGSAISGIQILSGSTQSGRIVFGDSENANIGMLIYDHSDNSMRFRVNSSEKMRLTSTGLGIGTTSPSEPLEVVGTARMDNSIVEGTLFAGSSVQHWGNNGTGIYFNTDIVTIQTASAERMRLTSGGNLLLGTTTDSGAALNVYKSNNVPLQVFGWSDRIGAANNANGSIYIGNNASFRGVIDYDASSTVDLIISNTYDNSTGGILFKTRTSGTANDVMILSGDGNVGIGTTSPAYPLEVNGTDTVSFAYHRTGVASKKWGFHTDNSNTYWQNLTDGLLALTISNSGNIGINTTSPSEKLHVVGKGIFTDQLTIPATPVATTDAASKSYVDAHGGGLGPFLPLTAGSTVPLSGNLYVDRIRDTNAEIIVSRTSSTNKIRLGSGDSNDVVNIYSGGQISLSASTNGNILIGTTTDYDEGKLQVYGDINIINPNGSNPTDAGSLYFGETGGVWGTSLYGFRINLNGSANNLQIQGAATSTVKTIISMQRDTAAVILGGSLTGTTATFTSQVTIPATPVASTDAASKGYVDQLVSETDTLQEVTDNGNTTTNSIMIGSSSSPTAQLTIDGENNSKGIELKRTGVLTGNAYFRLVGLSGSEALGFNINGTEKMRLTSDGKLGIGTTSPSFELDVAGNIGMDNKLYHNGDHNTYIGFEADDIKLRTGGIDVMTLNSSQNVGIGTTSPVTPIDISSESSTIASFRATGGTSNNKRLEIGSGGDRVIIKSFTNTTNVATAIAFNQGNTERMRITSAGSILIGTTTDSGAKLKITTSENATTSTSLYLENTGSGGSEGVSIVFNPMFGATSMIASNREGANSGLTNLSFHTCVVNDNPPIERMRLTSGGNLGIGTTSPTKKLHINGDIKVDNGSILVPQAYGINFGQSGYDILMPSSTRIAIKTAGTEKLSVLNNGNVLIGTTTDNGDKLQVNGNIQILDTDASDGSVFGYLNFTSTTGGSSGNHARISAIRDSNSAGQMLFSTKSGGSVFERLRITSGGNVLIGTTSASGEKLEVNGTAKITGTAKIIGNVSIGGSVGAVYKLDVVGKARVQSVLELDDVLTLNAISTPSDPANGKSSIYMDSADGAIKVKINVGGTVVTRTIASFE